jgi:DNA replication initiation complex subunit (GINS family)
MKEEGMIKEGVTLKEVSRKLFRIVATLIVVGAFASVSVAAAGIAHEKFGVKVLTPDEKNFYQEKFEADFEPVLAEDAFAREVISNNTERFVQYMHITDVLYGTDFCEGQTEDSLVKRLKADPGFQKTKTAEYFDYLDSKYN